MGTANPQPWADETVQFQAQLLDALEQAVIATDLDGTVRYLNHAAEALYRCSAAEALGQNVVDLTSSTLSRQQATEIMEQLRKGERWGGEFLIERRDGSTFPAWVIDAPIYAADGTIIGVVGISFDNTEPRQAQEALARTITARDRALEDARLALHDRNAFLAAVSHDLLSPLTAIQGFARLATRQVLRGQSTPERMLAHLTQITETANQMVDQIQELLDLARLQTGDALPLRRAPTDLVALAQSVVDQYRATTAPQGVLFIPAVAEIVGAWDALRLRRVLDNVLNNAIKYSNAGEAVTLVVDRLPTNGQDWATLTVQDHGLGIPAADLAQIFQPYQRGANVQGISGTGLGLAGAKHIVEEHGGTISIQSKEGEGTVVTIRLPLTD